MIPDFTNCFSCSGCGKSLPFGIKKCPICGYDYTDIKTSEKNLKYANIFITFCILWFFAYVGICHFNTVKRLSSIIGHFCLGFLPIIIFIKTKLNKELDFYKNQYWKVKMFDKLNTKEDYDYIDTRDYWDNSVVHKNWLYKLLNSDEENIKFDKND